ncbi:MAG: hypothetical protein NTX24_00515 [Candidatus Pacearchaeota archaeon]|nr:hypothetical protein [Candidatus Pacearchaeota archaeon]
MQKIIKREIRDLEEVLKSAIAKKVFQQESSTKTFDYKQKEKEYYKKEIENKIKKLKSDLLDLCGSKDKLTIDRIDDLTKHIELVFEKADSNSVEIIIKNLEKLESLAEILPEKKESIERASINNMDRDILLPSLPPEIQQEVKANFDELRVCFTNNCYRSSLILCGKVLEIALHRKYFELTGKDLLEKAPDIGLGNLIARMKEQGLDLDPGLPQQIHLINQLRIFTVHKKSQVFQPSKEQTQATILYTLDVLKKLFKR